MRPYPPFERGEIYWVDLPNEHPEPPEHLQKQSLQLLSQIQQQLTRSQQILDCLDLPQNQQSQQLLNQVEKQFQSIQQNVKFLSQIQQQVDGYQKLHVSQQAVQLINLIQQQLDTSQQTLNLYNLIQRHPDQLLSQVQEHLKSSQQDLQILRNIEKELLPSYTMRNKHMVVLLQDHTAERETVMGVPITGLYDERGKEKETISTDLILNKDNYSFLEKDSFIKCDQVVRISRNRLDEKVGRLTQEHMRDLDTKLIFALGLQDRVQDLIIETLERHFEKQLQLENKQTANKDDLDMVR